MRTYGLIIKPVADRIVAAVVLLVAAPAIVLVAVAIALTMGFPVIFRQERPGLRGRPFGLLKFRTMTQDCGPDGQLLPDSQRLTPLGRFLRGTSLDELPSLVNILLGQLSFVGPRPLLMSYLPLYSPRQASRHSVMPGLTGWAQVHGRNLVAWDERLELDAWYAQNQSLALDLRILARTVSIVLRGSGVSPHGLDTMPPFRGSQPK